MFFFYPRKKNEPEKIFNILPEKFSNWPRKNLENFPRKKNCAREKNRKIPPEKNKNLPEKKCKIVPEKFKKYPRKNPFENIWYEFFSFYLWDCGGLKIWLFFLDLFNAFFKSTIAVFV